MKTTQKDLLSLKVKGYKSELKRMVEEFYWVDETLASEYDLRIHTIAKRLINARKTLALTK